MQSIRRSLSFAGLSLMAMALTFAACTDDGKSPLGPEPQPPTPPLQLVTIECKASIKSLGMSCRAPRGSAGAASGVILAEQRVDVELSSNDLVVTADTFAFDVNVKNVFPQPTSGPRQRLGVDSLGVTHPIQVFFHEGPMAPHGGSVEVVNESGMGGFTNGGQLYFDYPVVLDSGEVSPDVRWKLRFSPEVDSLTFKVMVSAAVPRPTGWVDVSPDTARLTLNGTTTMTGVARNHAGQVVPGQAITWSSSNTAVATVDPSTGVVTGIAKGTAVITASTPTPGRYGTAVVLVSATPSVVTANYDAIENVTATVAAAQGLMTAVTDPDGDARITPGTYATSAGGSAVVEASGAFLYIGKAGYSGPDSFNFTVVDGVSSISALANVTVMPSPYWFVRAGATEAMDGTQAGPFPTVAAAQAAAVGPDAADSIIVLNAGATQHDGPVVLEAGQALIGEGIAIPLVAALNGAVDTIVGNSGEPILTRTTAGATVTVATNNLLRGLGITAANGAAVTGNGFGTLTVRETRLNPAGPALHLTNGTLDLDSAVLVSSTGSNTQGLFLSDVNGKLEADSGTIVNAKGTAFAVTGGAARIVYPGAISGPAALAVSIANRPASADSIILAGSISGNGEGISLTGNSGGTATFSGALNLTRKGILAQNNTGGTFAFTGAKTIDVDSTTYTGVSLATNTGATFVFAGGLAISTASGTGFSATGGGTVSVTGAGNTISTGTGTAVALDGVNTTSASGIGVTFASVNTAAATTGISLNAITGAGFQVTGTTGSPGSGGTINATGNGILLTALGATPVALDNLNVATTGAAAAYSAAGSSNLNVAGVVVNATGGPALSLASSSLNGVFSKLTSTGSASSAVILNTAAGTFSADSATLTGTAGGPTLAITGGAPAFTIAAGTITNNSGRAVVVNGLTGGSVSVAAAVNSGAPGGTGILVQNNAAAAAVAFTGAKTLATGANPAVSILTDASSVSFGGGNLNITTAGAIGFQVQGAGTVQVTGFNNTISTTGAVAASVQNTSSGAGGITFRSITGSGAANAIVLNTLTGTGFQVTGNGTASSGGTLSATNTAVLITAADSVQLKRVVVTAPAGVSATTFGGLRLDSATVISTAGAALNLTTGRFHTSDLALSATNGAALATNGVALAGTLDSLSATINTAATAVSLVNSTGTLAANNGPIAVSGAGSTAVSVSGGSAGLVFSGNVTQDANAPLLAVAAGHTGTLVFTNGTLNANNGTGIQLTDGDGTYAINGSLDLSGGDAGVDFGALSSGSLNVSPAAGHTASIVSPTGAAIAIAGGSGNLTFNGNVTQATASQPLLSVAGSHTGTVSFPTGTLTATNGTGLQFDNADGTYAFNGTVNLSNSVGGADAGIDVLNNSDGEFTFNANSTITNPANQAITIQNGVAGLAFTYSGSFTKNNNSVTGILVQNNAAGSITFNGVGKTRTLSTGTANAVSLVNNGTATTTFDNGGLNITTTSGFGFNATGSGRVQVIGAQNTVTSGTGTAVNIQNVTVGANGVEFRSVSATGGANGIVLSNTGNLGGFTVTGDGASSAANTTRGRTTSGASGAIALGSGGTISGTSGSGISLSNANTVVLRNMVVQNNSGDGITATTVAGLTVDNSRITGHASDHGILGTSLTGLTLTHSEVESNATTDGAVEAADIWNVRLVDFAGTGVIQNSRLRQSEETVLGVVNDAGTGTLTITNTNITDAGTTAGNGVQITARGSSNLTVTMQNDSINRTKSRGVTAVSDANATLAVNVSGSKFRDNFAGLEVATTSLGATTYNLVGNDFQWHESVPININRGSLAATPVTGSFRGTVENNTIGTAGQLGSGSSTANAGAQGGRGQGGVGIRVATNGQGGDTRVRIKGNVVREVINLGVNVIGRDGAHGLSVIYENNDVELPNHNLVSHATDIQAGASPTDQVSMCLDARANRSISPFSNGLRVRTNSGVQTTTNNQVALAQWDGVTAVNTFLANQNPALGDNVSTTTSGGPFTATGSCSAP